MVSEQIAKTAGKLAENILLFARALRLAGVPVGPDRIIDALHAVEITGVERREDFYWTLASVFLGRREHLELFDQAFRIFWHSRYLTGHQTPGSLLADSSKPSGEESPGHRLAEALIGNFQIGQELRFENW